MKAAMFIENGRAGALPIHRAQKPWYYNVTVGVLLQVFNKIVEALKRLHYSTSQLSMKTNVFFTLLVSTQCASVNCAKMKLRNSFLIWVLNREVYGLGENSALVRKPVFGGDSAPSTVSRLAISIYSRPES